MKSILISIRPEWVAKILNDEKTLEIRKTAPKCDLPVDVYIYCTKSSFERLHKNKNGWFVNEMSTIFLDGVATEQDYNGKVVAKFTLREVEEICIDPFGDELSEEEEKICSESCLSLEELVRYLREGMFGYAWHISDLQIFDKPKEITEFFEPHECGGLLMPLIKAPQSWRYVEAEE